MKKCMCWCLSIIELKNARWNIENSNYLLWFGEGNTWKVSEIRYVISDEIRTNIRNLMRCSLTFVRLITYMERMGNCVRCGKMSLNPQIVQNDLCRCIRACLMTPEGDVAELSHDCSLMHPWRPTWYATVQLNHSSVRGWYINWTVGLCAVNCSHFTVNGVSRFFCGFSNAVSELRKGFVSEHFT